MSEFIDDIMGFNPQDLSVFNEPVSNNTNNNIYKTDPAKSKSEDGHYRSKIRIIYNPFDIKHSIVHQAVYAMTDKDGLFIVKSKLGNGDKSCPIFKSWKTLYFSNDEQKKEWSKKMYDKTESRWVLVQILEDENQPELKGAIKVMKLPKDLFEKMTAKMNPAPATKKAPVPIMDYLMGLPLDMDVQPGPDDPQNPLRKQRERSYTLCDFSSDYEPIIKIDGTPLFDETELETIDAYVTAKNEIAKAKTEAKRAEKRAAAEALIEPMKALYNKAVEYLKANAINLVDECAYKDWDEATTARVNAWIENVTQMRDPANAVTVPTIENPAPTVSFTDVNPTTTAGITDSPEDDLPF